MLFVFLLLLLCQSQGRQHNTNNNNNRTVACSSTDRVSMGVGELSVVNSESTPWSNTASAHVVQRREARQSTQNAHNNSGRASPLTTTRHSTPPQRWANSTATPYCFFGCFFDLDDLTFVGMVLLAVASALALTCFLATLGSLLLLTVYKRCCGRTSSSVKRAAVLVLGDVGRSPRMQYHAWSIAELNRESTNGVRFEVDLIGYTGEDCIERVRNNDAITLRRFTPLKKPSPKIPFILWAPFKVFAQLERLLCLLLFGIPTPDVLLVQTPPAIPTLFVAIVACAITGARLVVDWHNFGYTILQINLKSARHPFVRVAYWYERVLAKFSSGNFCVTDAMRDWLAAQWGVTAAVLHDQPPDFFHRTAIGDMHRLFRKFETNPASGLKRSIFGTYFDDGSGGGGADESTLLTVVDAATGEPRLRDDRPAMVVSSTSWTEDEDFGILLDAIVALDKLVSAEADVHTVDGGDAPSFPRLLVVVTGKGPQKAMYVRHPTVSVLAIVLGSILAVSHNNSSLFFARHCECVRTCAFVASPHHLGTNVEHVPPAQAPTTVRLWVLGRFFFGLFERQVRGPDGADADALL